MLPGHLAAAPLALAAASGVLVRVLETGRPRLARAAAAGSLLAQLALALLALAATGSGRALAYSFAPWPTRAALTLVLDPLSAWLLLATALLALIAHSSSPGTPARVDPRRRSWLQFELLALDGVLLVSDLGSLFVCLVSAWALASRAVAAYGGEIPARAMLAGAALALALALGCILVALGTLDFAGLALAAPAQSTAEGTLATSAEFALLAVLAFGAIAVPLALWRPPGSAQVPASALVLGVGLATGAVYPILRLYTLAFPCFIAGPCGPSGLALPLGLAFVTGGALAGLAARHARGLIAWLMVLSVGLVLVAAGSLRAAGLGAAVYLLMHATLVGAALLLSSEVLAERRAGRAAAGALVPFGLALAAVTCLPPLSGFLGTVALLRASGPDALAVWTLVLTSMLVALVATVRNAPGFGAAEPASLDPQSPASVAAGAAVGLLLALGVAAGPALQFSGIAARQLLDRAGYVAAVAAARGGGAGPTH